MRRGFWRVPGGIVDPGETPQAAAARALFEEAGITPTGPLWLVTAVPLQGYGLDLRSLRYACQGNAGDVESSHAHSDWGWVEPATSRATHVRDEAVERWWQSSPDDAFTVLSNRNGLDDFLRWHGSRL